jgi:hypothetical protein
MERKGTAPPPRGFEKSRLFSTRCILANDSPTSDPEIAEKPMVPSPGQLLAIDWSPGPGFLVSLQGISFCIVSTQYRPKMSGLALK